GARLGAGGGVQGLAIDAAGGAGGVGLLRSADLLAQEVMDGVQRAVVPPLVEVPPDRTLGREVPGEVAPLAAGPQDVEDGIDDIPEVGLSRPPAEVDRKVRLDPGALPAGHVARVGLRSHASFYPP